MHTTLSSFTNRVKNYYYTSKRILPWREEITPYGVLLSEVMLQQTQVSRVEVKYHEFRNEFPDFQSLADASLPQVLRAWQGLGYNRRGMFLKQAAERITFQFGGVVPDDPQIVDSLPGIGPATAAAIVTYIYNIPTVFIETNIRRVYLHHFFPDSEGVPDSELYPIIEKSLDRDNPRDWYYALMDYGSYLAKILPNPNTRSKHYTRQSAFEGSPRQVRAGILRHLLNNPGATVEDLKTTARTVEFVDSSLESLEKEGMVIRKGIRIFIRE